MLRALKNASLFFRALGGTAQHSIDRWFRILFGQLLGQFLQRKAQQLVMLRSVEMLVDLLAQVPWRPLL